MVFAATDRDAAGRVDLPPSALGVFFGTIRGIGSMAPRSSANSLDTLTVVNDTPLAFATRITPCRRSAVEGGGTHV